MNRGICLVAIVCMLSGCGLFKRQLESEQKRSSSSAELLSSKEKNISKERHVFTIRDSTQEDLVVEIVPNGPFSYSFGNGFKGTATTIKLRGKRTGSAQILGRTDLANTQQQVRQSTSQKKETESLSKSRLFKFDMRFFLLLISVILIGLLWVWWRCKRK